MPDQTLQCVDCGQDWVFSEGQQKFFQEKNLTTPKRCESCRQKKRERNDKRGSQQSERR